MNEAIREMKKVPGIYWVGTRFTACLVEVDEDGTVHQLTQDELKRDGELDDEGWSPAVEVRSIISKDES